MMERHEQMSEKRGVLWELKGVRVGKVKKGKDASDARLKDVFCEIKEGVTAVVGCSGAGKSTLLNLLVGFEKVDGGRVVAGEGVMKKVFWGLRTEGCGRG